MGNAYGRDGNKKLVRGGSRKKVHFFRKCVYLINENTPFASEFRNFMSGINEVRPADSQVCVCVCVYVCVCVKVKQ